MKAFVHKQVENGNDRLGTGINAGMVTPEYRDYTNMKRHFLSQLPCGIYHVEAFHNWDHRYSKPDLDTIYTVESATASTHHLKGACPLGGCCSIMPISKTLEDLLRRCRMQIRDGIIFSYAVNELCERPEATIEEINKVLGEEYDLKTGTVVDKSTC